MMNSEWYSSQRQWVHRVFPAKRLTKQTHYQQSHSTGSMTTSAPTTTFQGVTGSQIVGISCGIEKKGIFLVVTFSLLSSENSSLDVVHLKVALQSLSAEELFWFPVLDSRQKVSSWCIQPNSLSWKVFHVYCIQYPVCQRADSHTVDLQPLNVQKVLAALGRKPQTCSTECWGLESLGRILPVSGILLPCLQFTFANTFL